MSIDWKKSESKLKRSLETENTRGEWWLHEPYSKIIKDANQAHLWLYHCAYNKLTGRWHVPMKRFGSTYTFLYDNIRKRESGIVYCLNTGFKDRRGGFYDSAMSDGKRDFWFVCDDYIEVGDIATDNAPPPLARPHDELDTRILSWVWDDFKKGIGGYQLAYVEGKQDKIAKT